MNHKEYFGKSIRQDWATPASLFDPLDMVFHFNLDIAASPENSKCDRFFSYENSAMENDWNGRGWCNPPYSRDPKDPASLGVKDFLARGFQQMEENPACQIICFLVSAATDTAWFQDYCFNADILCFIRGRLKFEGAKNSQTKGSALVLLSKLPYTKAQLDCLRNLGKVITRKQKTANDYCPEPVNVQELIDKGLISL